MSEETQIRRRVLLMVPHLGGGGAERVIARVAAGLDGQRFEVHLAVVTDDAPGAVNLPEWVTVHRLHAQRVRRCAVQMVRLLWQLRPAVVIPGMMHLSALLLALKPLLPRGTRIAPRVNTTVSRSMPRGWERCVYAWLLQRADFVVCQTEAMAEDVRGHLRVQTQSLIVAPNPVPVNELRCRATEARAHMQASDGAVHVLCAGRLADEKGVDLLLQAWAKLDPSQKQARLSIVGDGAERDRLEALQHALKLETTVDFVGFQVDVAQWLGWADVLVQPSRWEGMPNALLEGAAAGLLLVTTPSSEGVVQMLKDVPGAWVTQEISAAALAEALRKAIAAARERYGQRMQHDFLEPWDEQAALKRWNQCVMEILDGAGTRGRPR